jgi:predicted O-methyltransferase YrrM
MPLSALRAAVGCRRPLVGRWPIGGGSKPSLIAPVAGAPSPRLLDTALGAVDGARSVELGWLTARSPDDYPDLWPGEHYKLLTALVALLRPKTVVEIGTATGMSALAMKQALPEDGRIVTFDLVPWQEHPDVVLQEDDFTDRRLEQRLADLSTPTGWRESAELLRSADFIFVDALHDGVQERNFLRGFDEVGLAGGPIVMFDDIRLWTMLAFWQEIARPKLDLTSFGHWSGTGLVDYA